MASSMIIRHNSTKGRPYISVSGPDLFCTQHSLRLSGSHRWPADSRPQSIGFAGVEPLCNKPSMVFGL